MESIIAAVIAAAASITVCLLNSRSMQEKTMQANKDTITEIINSQKEHQQEINAQHQQTIAIIEFKIETLTNEVRRHNNFAERLPVLEEKIKVANNRIDDLEEEAKK